jgi:hypothetical protein
MRQRLRKGRGRRGRAKLRPLHPPEPSVYGDVPSLISPADAATYRSPLEDVFWTFARPFTIYVDAQVANISTSPTYSRFGQHDQNAAIGVDNPAVTPQAYTVTGCITYGNNQQWTDFSVGQNGQLKLKDTEGQVRIKVEQQGYDLIKDAKLVNLDGFSFQFKSNPRPHGLLGSPSRWTFFLERVE